MAEAQVHFELFVRRRPASPWALDLACEDRARTLEAAEEALQGGATAVKVVKETLDPETRAFRSVTIHTAGEMESKRRERPDVETAPLCVSPQDLYTVHARERIGRLLEGFLKRHAVTPFELLHRPDLVDALEASGADLQHAVQKIAVPEAQARGVSVHEVIRGFQKLIERAIARVARDGRRAVFPDLEREPVAAAAERLMGEPEPAYRLGGGVAAYIGQGRGWRAKLSLILDLADGAPDDGPARELVLQVLEQPLREIAGVRASLAEVVGKELDTGGALAAFARLAAPTAVQQVIAFDPGLERQLPPLGPEAARLARWLEQGAFAPVRASLAKRVLAELTGPRRLRPSDVDGEIAVLRALAMALTAAAGPWLPADDVQHAFVERSRQLVTGDFVEAYLAGRGEGLAKAQALVHLAENVAGPVNKRAAARWIVATVGGLKFEKDLRASPTGPATRLAALAGLQRALRGVGLPDADRQEIDARLGELGGLVEADAGLCALVAKAATSVVQRLSLLLSLAAGEAAPLGPAADRAKGEALKILRDPRARADLGAAPPETLAKVRTLIAEAGLAA